MKKTMIRNAWVALAVGCLVGTAPAQEGQPGSQEDTGIRIRALAFEIQGEIPAEMYAHADPSDGKSDGVKIDVKNYLNHEFNTVPSAMKKMVWTDAPDAASASQADRVLAKVKVPDRMRSGIFMLLPGTGKEGDPKFRVLPIDDSRRAFPPGSLKVMNLSPMEVRIQLEKTPFTFKPGATEVIDDMPVGANNIAGMQAFARMGEGWQRIGAGGWPHPGQKRVLQILFENPASKKIEMRGFRDVAALP